MKKIVMAFMMLISSMSAFGKTQAEYALESKAYHDLLTSFNQAQSEERFAVVRVSAETFSAMVATGLIIVQTQKNFAADKAINGVGKVGSLYYKKNAVLIVAQLVVSTVLITREESNNAEIRIAHENKEALEKALASEAQRIDMLAEAAANMEQ